MSISFPTSPSVGQIYQNWVWSGKTWDAVAPGLTLQMRRQIFTASGAYTPSPGMFQADVECLGGGGGGGAASAQGQTGAWVSGGGGGAGSYSKRLLTSTQIGASQTVTIGAGGAGGTANALPGAAGGAANGTNTSFGTLCAANGGGGGQAQIATGGNAGIGVGGAAGTGDIALPGQSGFGPFSNGTGGAASAVALTGGAGGSSPYGAGGAERYPAGAANVTGNNGSGYGSGGAGGFSLQTTGYAAGGAGAPGLCIVTEYCWITQAAVAAQAASGARVLVATATVNPSTPVASVVFNNLTDTTVDIYELDFISVTGSVNAVQFGLRASKDNGTTWDTTVAYNSGWYAGGASFLVLSQPMYGNYPSAPYAIHGHMRIYRPWHTSLGTGDNWWFFMDAVGFNNGPGTPYGNVAHGYYTNGPYSAIQFTLQGAGNITTGTFNLYKVVR